MIQVTQPFLPPKAEYEKYLGDIWQDKWLTNNGQYVRALEKELINHLDVTNLKYLTNGTLALQLAIKALDLKGEIITTPFSFVATTTSIIWGNCTPVFVDIEPLTLTIDVEKIEAAITEKTTAIMPTHVYGIPCDVEAIEKIAKKHSLKVIYDGAHAFGVKYKGQSIFNYGDISTYSFHATKVFHTVEGGGITCNGDPELINKVELLRSYGFRGNDFYLAGINAKGTEFHAAMGLCNLNYIDSNFNKRKTISELYNSLLPKEIQLINIRQYVEYNYAYYPILLKNEEQLTEVIERLAKGDIHTRRYFYPSLNKLPYILGEYKCSISEDISKRVLCLPIYADLEIEEVKRIAGLVNSIVSYKISNSSYVGD
ncbi:DegT/DnrJ/EryC1/StrS family aminotransferase [Lysinibacillus sp. FSL R7-0073]|uniref:DegT/DnrJ/EryC1/StrS family aminotransferase n=1 Tax=Lysinibacillus TaxID=400634 RepID=UPI002E24A63E|nr:DegT/DnrJ/EryC1/StrS family aminotransferase [Lysinibacillus fusiformis]